MSEEEFKMKRGFFVVLFVFAATALCVSQQEQPLCSIYTPRMVMDDHGCMYVVWAGWQASVSSNVNIYWMRVDASGNPGEVKKVSTHPDNVRRDNEVPQIAVDTSGNSYVVWEGGDGHDDEIYWVRVDASGTPGEVQKISTHPDNEETNDFHPLIAVDASGNSYVVWEGGDGHDDEIYWVRVDASGAPGEAKRISAYPDTIDTDDGYPQIAVDSMGNSCITWRGRHIVNETSEIYWARIDPSGTHVEVKGICSEGSYRIPYIGVDASGNSYVVWTGSDGHDDEIYWVRVDASGTPGEFQKISTHPDNEENDDFCSNIAVDASGNSYVVWRSCIGGSCWNAVGNYEIYWVRVDASGAPGEAKRISTHPDNVGNHDIAPQLAIDTMGNSYVVWFCRGNHSYEIYWVRVDASGNPGEVQKVPRYEEDKTYDNFDPQIAVDGSGNSYVVWRAGWAIGDEYYFCTIYWTKIDAAGNFMEMKKIYTCC